MGSVTDPFWLCTGPFQSIAGCYNLKQLKNSLKTAPVSAINHHVSKKHNDFANWIEDVIKYKALGIKIRKLKAKNNAELKKKILKELEGATNPKSLRKKLKSKKVKKK